MTEHNFDLFPSLSQEERSRSLQELDGQDWGEATFPSYLVRTCHALRRKPLRDFTIEDLRIMIGQNIGLEYLVPLAIERLQRDPFAAGDFYPGDLLGNVLTVESSFWQQRPDLRQAVEAIVALIPDFPDILDKDLSVFRQERFLVSCLEKAQEETHHPARNVMYTASLQPERTDH